MAVYPSNYLDDRILDHLLGTASYTSPANVYLALYTSNPTAADSGTEVSGGSYARQAITFSASSGGATSNSADVTFTDLPTATITHYGIRDAASAGNLLFFGELATSIPATSGDEATFATGEIDITVAGS